METTTSPQKKGNHTAIELIMLFILILMAAVLYYVYSSNKATSLKQQNLQTTVPTIEPSATPLPPTATPTPKPIPHGKVPFTVSIGSEMKGPRMGGGSIDPYDPTLGAKQQVTIEVVDKIAPIQKVVAILKTDHKTFPEIELKPLNDGTIKWQGEWVVDDSYLYTYVLTIKATSGSGTSYVDILLR